MRAWLAGVLKRLGLGLVRLGTASPSKGWMRALWFLLGAVAAFVLFRACASDTVKSALPGVLHATRLDLACERYLPECQEEAVPAAAPLAASARIIPNEPDDPAAILPDNRGDATHTVGGHPLSWLPRRAAGFHRDHRIRCADPTVVCTVHYRTRKADPGSLDEFVTALCAHNKVTGAVGSGCGSLADGTWSIRAGGHEIRASQTDDEPVTYSVTVTPDAQ